MDNLGRWKNKPAEKKLRKTKTEEECFELVRQTQPGANGATWGKGGKYAGWCYAELGATSVEEFEEEGTVYWACLFKGQLL